MSAEHVAIPLAPVDAVRITILMDNVTDPLLFPPLVRTPVNQTLDHWSL